MPWIAMGNIKGVKKVKFMQSLEEKALRQVRREARKRSITVQECIRAVMIPDWLEHHRGKR